MIDNHIRGQIRAVLLDWGDTLIRPPGITTDGEGHFRCVEEFYHEHIILALGPGTALDWTRFRGLYKRATMEQIERTLATGREHSFSRRIARALELGGIPDALDTTACDLLAEDLGSYIARACTAMPDATRVLPRLRTRLRTGLLSNYPHAPVVRMSLENASLLKHLDSVTISAETGWSKPWQQAFAAAISDLGHEPGEILFVGDDLDNDMAGAKAAGMHTAWLPRADQDANVDYDFVDLRLTTLADLIPLVDETDR